VSSRLSALRFDAVHPHDLARFWAGVLGGWKVAEDGATLVSSSENDIPIRFSPGADPKTGQNQIHFDLTSASDDQQNSTVAKALAIGGKHIDIGQSPEELHVVLADPEGNEFCVVGAGNKFLADCGFLGAVNCDGTRALGYFWGEVLGWPLVWDQDEETAIRSPAGGPMVTWSGPPVRPKLGKNRVRFEISLSADDVTAELERLVALGATLVSSTNDTFEFLDPDGNEFTVVG
jgi:predicted enzyme related to lactoylglutathione lyase